MLMFTKLRFSWTKLTICLLLTSSIVLGVKFNDVKAQLATLRTIMNDVWKQSTHQLMTTAWTGGATANTSFETETTIFNDVWNQSGHYLNTSGGGGGGGGGSLDVGTTNAAVRYKANDTTAGPSTGIQLSTTEILSVKNKVTTVSADTTLGEHNIVRCVAGGGTKTLTLPSANTSIYSRYEIIKDDATGTCQVARAGSDTFNGLTGPIIITTRYDSIIVDLIDNGSPGVWRYTAVKAQFGYVQLSMKGADLPSSNAGIIDVSEPRPKILFDATTSWCVSWTFNLNPDYGTSPQIVYKYSMTSATSGSAMMGWYVWKTTSAQAEDGETAGYDAVNTCTDAAVPGTAGRISQITCALTNNDSMAANDQVTIKACRDIADTATGNLELLSAQLQYYKQ